MMVSVGGVRVVSFFLGKEERDSDAHRENANVVQLRFIVRRDTRG